MKLCHELSGEKQRADIPVPGPVPDERAARALVADAGRTLLRERLAARTWGNISCRTGARSYVITPSGLGYEHTSADDVVPYDMSKDIWAGSREPSSEKDVHTAVYRRFPGAGAVVHTHQTYASALGLAGFGELTLTDEEIAALGGLALAEYGPPGSARLADNVSSALDGAQTVLMAHHGALIAGRDLDEAFRRARLLETVCRAACKGQPAPAGDEAPELAELAEQAGHAFLFVAYTAAPAVRRASETAAAFPAQLDDMAQMIGPQLVTTEPSPSAVEKALSARNAVLVSGAGAICRADTAEDCEALRLLVEKACVGFLHTRALGVSAALPLRDVLFMRETYLTKYSGKIDG